jgi:hypothetical protein
MPEYELYSILIQSIEFGRPIVGVRDDTDVRDDACEQLVSCDAQFHFSRIKEEDGLKLLQGLDPNKAVGVDMIGESYFVGLLYLTILT